MKRLIALTSLTFVYLISAIASASEENYQVTCTDTRGRELKFEAAKKGEGVPLIQSDLSFKLLNGVNLKIPQDAVYKTSAAGEGSLWFKADWFENLADADVNPIFYLNTQFTHRIDANKSPTGKAEFLFEGTYTARLYNPNNFKKFSAKNFGISCVAQ